MANVLFSGLTPGLVGLYQVNIRVPSGLSSGDQSVVVSLPPYQKCCTPGTNTTYSVPLDSKSVKLTVR
jgi:hypothetical protein